jgi:tetratricopeptide (TPR) repeat protein
MRKVNMKKIVIIITMIFMTSSAVYASYEEAVKLFEEKKYEESLNILADILVVDDDMKEGSPNYKIRFLAAHNHWKLGNAKSVIAHLRRCMDINPATPDPYIDLGIYFLENKRYGDAVTIAEEGLKVKEDHMFFWILGRVAMAHKDYIRAKELFEKVNTMNPEFYVSYNDLGITLMKLKRYGEADAAFSVALAIKPDSAEINNNMALCYFMAEKYKEALTYAEKAAELNPESSEIINTIERIKKLEN